MSPRLILHLPPHYRRDFARRSPGMFYRRLASEFESRGVTVQIEPRESKGWQAILEDGDLHVVENGDVQGPNVLNATIAYIQGFWHVDAKGVLCDSSIGDAAFDPDTVPGAKARPFFRELRDLHVGSRSSRYTQKTVKTAFPTGLIAVFLQGGSAMTDRARLFPTDVMLRAVAEGAGGRPIAVKSHPLNRDAEEEAAVAALIDEGFDLRMTSANIHDILAPAAMTVSINSAVAMEGFLHRTPAVLFGKTDFHHFAELVRSPDGFPVARDRALTRNWGYGKYLYWYLHERCLQPTSPDFFARFMDRAGALGFDAARFGFDPVAKPDRAG